MMKNEIIDELIHSLNCSAQSSRRFNILGFYFILFLYIFSGHERASESIFFMTPLFDDLIQFSFLFFCYFYFTVA
jgi:hypothetical protein